MFEDISKVLLITDMDGTFLPSSKVPGEKSLKAIEKFQKDGGKFSIATGRAIQASEQYFQTVKVNCPIIMCNGGMVYDLENKKQVYDVYLPDHATDIVDDVLGKFPSVGCEFLTFDGVYVPALNETEKRHIETCKVKPVYCKTDEVPKDKYKVLFADEPENIDRIVEYVDGMDWHDVDFVRSTERYYEILPRNISKGSALEHMRKLCNMQGYTFVAVGDYDNDIEMIKTADVGICPSNAADNVKEIADITLNVSCEEDVIAEVIDYIYRNIM